MKSRLDFYWYVPRQENRHVYILVGKLKYIIYIKLV